jgi:hypothetical protein
MYQFTAFCVYGKIFSYMRRRSFEKFEQIAVNMYAKPPDQVLIQPIDQPANSRMEKLRQSIHLPTSVGNVALYHLFGLSYEATYGQRQHTYVEWLQPMMRTEMQGKSFEDVVTARQQQTLRMEWQEVYRKGQLHRLLPDTELVAVNDAGLIINDAYITKLSDLMDEFELTLPDTSQLSLLAQ